MEEKVTVLLWVYREESHPDPKRAMKYPREISRKRNPASPWLRFNSFSISGIKGARVTLAKKFRKKIEVKIRSGLIWDRKLSDSADAMFPVTNGTALSSTFNIPRLFYFGN
jgi:hypothetical protein